MIDQAQILTMLLTIIVALFGVLTVIMGWMGNKLYNRLGLMAESMHNIETDLHGKISDLDRRVTIVETRCPHTPENLNVQTQR